MGHELVDIEEKFNEDYVSLEEAHEATATKLRETLAVRLSTCGQTQNGK
jgi:hypothetical protein